MTPASVSELTAAKLDCLCSIGFLQQRVEFAGQLGIKTSSQLGEVYDPASAALFLFTYSTLPYLGFKLTQTSTSIPQASPWHPNGLAKHLPAHSLALV